MRAGGLPGIEPAVRSPASRCRQDHITGVEHVWMSLHNTIDIGVSEFDCNVREFRTDFFGEHASPDFHPYVFASLQPQRFFPGLK